MFEPQCIILAAGASRRFGSAKMHHLLPSGKTILQQTIDVYSQVFASPIVVVPESDQVLEKSLASLDVHIVLSSLSHLGMSESLKAGMHACADSDVAMIVLGDMPYIHTNTIEEIRAAGRLDNIVVPRFHGRVGNPVCFGRDFYPALFELEGDRGAKRVVSDNHDSVNYVDTNDEGLVLDIDYPSAILD